MKKDITVNILTIYLLFCLSAVVVAQKPMLRFSSFTINNGLSQSSVYCMLQDRRGYLWIGTEDGLNRYDGHECKVYRNIVNDSTSLSENTITALCEDYNGNIWVGTRGGGLNCYVVSNEQFIRYNKQFPVQTIQTLFVTNDKTIWIGASGGLFYFANNRFDEVKVPSWAANIKAITATTDKIWLGTDAGLSFLQKQNNQYTFHQYQTNDGFVVSDNISALYTDAAQNVWCGTWGNGLAVISSKSGNVQRYTRQPDNAQSLPDNYIHSITEDAEGNIWIGTYNGGLAFLSLYNRNTGIFHQYAADAAQYSVSSNDIRCVLHDRSGVVWVGTYVNGLNHVNPYTTFFEHLGSNVANKKGLTDNIIFSILEDRNKNLWVGTFDKGLNFIDNKNQNIVHYTTETKQLPNNQVWALAETQNAIWIGTFGGGLVKYQNNTFTTFDTRNSGLNNNFIWCIAPDNNGLLWIGTNGGGVNILNTNNNEWINWTHNPDNHNSLSNNNVWCITLDNNQVWIGTNGGGLNLFDQNTVRFTHFRHDVQNPNSLSHDEVWCVTYDQKHNLWVGTNGGGLNKLADNNGLFRRYTEADGLPNNVIYGILPDTLGFLWLTTNRGLSRMDTRAEKFENFVVNDGLQSNEFNAVAYHKGKTGKMYVGGINGVSIFSPAKVRKNPYPAVLSITGVTLTNRNGNNTSLATSFPDDTITIHADIAAITIHFNGFYFSNPAVVEYQYKLDGHNSDWISCGKQRYAFYASLPVGTYHFRLQATTDGKTWFPCQQTLVITKQAGWGRVAIFLSVIAAIVAVILLLQADKKPAKNKNQTTDNPETPQLPFAHSVTPNVPVLVQTGVLDIQPAARLYSHCTFAEASPSLGEQHFVWLIENQFALFLVHVEATRNSLADALLLSQGSSIVKQCITQTDNDATVVQQRLQQRLQAWHDVILQHASISVLCIKHKETTVHFAGKKYHLYKTDNHATTPYLSLQNSTENVDFEIKHSPNDTLYAVIGNSNVHQAPREAINQWHHFLVSLHHKPLSQQRADIQQYTATDAHALMAHSVVFVFKLD